MRRFLVFLAILSSVFIFGCGGGSGSSEESTKNDNDADAGRKQGELYGECYPNETCNKGLVCDIENNICIKDPGNSEETDSDSPDNSNDEDSNDQDDINDDSDHIEIPDKDSDVPQESDEDSDDIDDTEISDEDSDNPQEPEDHDNPEIPDETPDNEIPDNDNPEPTENHKITGSYQIGNSVSGLYAAIFECGKSDMIATTSTDNSGKFSFNADISVSKTYCVKVGGFASCFKGMSDHVANVSEITNAVYLLDENCADLRKSETKVRAYAKLGTGKWLGELDYSKLSGIKEGIKLLSAFLKTTDAKTLSEKIAADIQKTDGREFEKFFSGFKISANRKEVVINTATPSSNEVALNIEGGSNEVAEGYFLCLSI